MPDVSYYLSKLTSEHAGQPNLAAVLTALVQPFVDAQAALVRLNLDFDLDYAVGVQLDAVGVRVGRSRYLPTPIDAYFSLDVDGQGLDQGVLFMPHDPTSGVTRLPDEQYRLLLRAVVIANNWDGTVEQAYSAYDEAFADRRFFILIQDTPYEQIGLVLAGDVPDAVTKGLFSIGELSLKPAGYELRHYLPTAYPAAVLGGVPLFGVDAQNDVVAGLDTGALVQLAYSE